MSGTYVVMSTGYLLVHLGNRNYAYQAVRHVNLHLTPGGARSNVTTALRGTPDDDFSQDRKERETEDAETLGAFQIRTVQGAHTIGATNPSFVAPSATDVANNPPGQALADASVALLSFFSSNGVPSEHSTTAYSAVQNFQTAWNADPLSQINANGTLSVDGAYGPNTYDALNSISGGSAPAVNTSPASPSSSSTTTTVPGGSTTTTTTTSTTNNIFAGMPVWAKWVVGAAAVGGVYVVGKAAYKKHGGTVRGHASRLHARLRHHARRLTHRPA